MVSKNNKPIDSVSRLCVRIAIIFTIFYIPICHILETLFNIEACGGYYLLPIETSLCICVYAQGNYHCRYIRWASLTILVMDFFRIIGYRFDIQFNRVYAIIIPLMWILLALAIAHYIRVIKIKKRNGREKRKSYTKDV